MDIQQAMAIPYTRTVTRGSDGVYTSGLVELPGAVSEGATAEQAITNLESALRMYFEVMIEDGQPFPEPVGQHAFSGEFKTRITPALHARLVLYAEVEGVSMNRAVADAIATYVGYRPIR